MRDHTADLVAALIALLPPDADAAALADALWLAASAQPADAPSATGATGAAASTARPAPPAPAPAPAPAAPPEGPPPHPATPLYEPQPAGPTGPRVEVAAARALPHALDAGRALRPFKRRYPHGPRRTLDLDATVDAYTRTGELLPVLGPTPERWFEVVVLTDTGPTMEIWQDALDEFTTLLTGLGAFRRIRRLHLHLDPHPEVTDTHGRPVPPARLPQRRRVLLVLTDCAGPHWRTPAIWQLLHTWGAHGPVALLNPLPGRLRHRTALDLPAVRVRHRRPDARNTELAHAVPPMLTAAFGPDADWVPLPTPTLAPHSLRRWADAMMRGATAGHDAVLVPAAGTLESPFATPEDETEAEDPARLAAAFLHTAGPAARRLAALCSPFSRLSLPLLRLVRQEAVPEAGTDDLAEVLTSGLLDTSTPTALAFHPEARAALARHLTRHDAWTVHTALTHHLATHRPRPGHTFPAIASDDLPADLQPFATATADLLALLAPTRRHRPTRTPAPRRQPHFPDPARSAAVLIGILGPEEHDAIDDVRTALYDLLGVLTSPTGWDLPVDRCHVLPDTSDPAQVPHLLAAADQEAEDTLLVHVYGDEFPGGLDTLLSSFLGTRHRAPGRSTVLLMDGENVVDLVEPIEQNFAQLAGSIAVLAVDRRGARDFSLARILAIEAETGMPGGPDTIDLETVTRLSLRRSDDWSGSSLHFHPAGPGPAILRNRQALSHAGPDVRSDYGSIRADLEAHGVRLPDDVAPLLLALVAFSHDFARQEAHAETWETSTAQALQDFLWPALALDTDESPAGERLYCRRSEAVLGLPVELQPARADGALLVPPAVPMSEPFRVLLHVGPFDRRAGHQVFSEEGVCTVVLRVRAPGPARTRPDLEAEIIALPDHEGQQPPDEVFLQLADFRAMLRTAAGPFATRALHVQFLIALAEDLHRASSTLARRPLCLAIGRARSEGTARVRQLWATADHAWQAVRGLGGALAVLLTDELHQDMQRSGGTVTQEFVPVRLTGESGAEQAWFGVAGLTAAELIALQRPTASLAVPPNAGYSESRLVRQLREVGVRNGGVLFVQADDRVLASVRPDQLISALRQAVGPEGTVVMSAATPENSSNSGYTRAVLDGLTPAARSTYLAHMPPFDHVRTPVSASAGSLPDFLRVHPGSVRSGHPQHSFVAAGKWADYLMAGHRLDSPHGEHSPLGKLYQSRAQVLLLGVPLNRCVAWNLAAERTPNPQTVIDSCVVQTRDGGREWVGFAAVAAPDLDAPELLDLLEARLPLRRGLVADQPAVLAPVEAGVDLVAAWLTDTAG
ncbi:SAV_2336 N-terminal domain-related protein [Kitasatospora sp. NPDC059646]|uniref:SAV_2336 N-terminal domain-related protein n=1 Tax=Kitasatospora sp. NPDC059646 TaxID=3346893 RepID=UPI003694D292